jgi:hypothetical protein
MRQLYGDRYEIDSVDMWQEHMEWPANQLSKSYNFFVQHSFLWKCIFNAPEPLHQANIDLNAQVSGNKLRKAFDDLRPDLVSPRLRSCYEAAPNTSLRSSVSETSETTVCILVADCQLAPCNAACPAQGIGGREE